ncbi:hypothetical protein D3C87_2153950 [compost metagenome]
MEMPSSSEAGRSTRAIGKAKPTASSVPKATPISAPGTSFSFAGRNFSQPIIASSEATPTISASV